MKWLGTHWPSISWLVLYDGHEWPPYDTSDPKVAWIEDDVDIRPFAATELMLAVNKLR